jgi:UDP-N-acetylbacillosamine N-acetyltransferase
MHEAGHPSEPDSATALRPRRMIPNGLLILGFGGHARSVGDVAIDLGIPALIFVDAAVGEGEEFAGFPARSTIPAALGEGWNVFPAAGDNLERRRQLDRAGSNLPPVARLVSRRAYLGFGATILPGTFVAHHAHIGPLASIGRATIINTGAIVDHESRIGDFTHISVNATVAGRCSIGSMVFLGAGATVIDRVRVADGVTIGAGATVVGDITEPGVYVGSPARRIGN